MKIRPLLEINTTQMAQAELAAQQGDTDKAERIQNARQNDQQRLKTKENEIEDLENSNDPLDREIFNLRKRLAMLLQRKQQKMKT